MKKVASKPQDLYSIEAEQSVLGALLIENERFDDIAACIQEHDFYLGVHRLIFRSISVLLSAGKAVDILTLEQHLKSQATLEDVGGLAYLAEITKNTVSTANTVAYADIIADYSKRRRILGLGQLIIQEIQAPKSEEDLDHLVGNIEKTLTDITLQRHQQDTIANLNTALEKIVARMEHAAHHRDPVSGTPSGIRALDETTTGGQPGDLIILAARPSMGKTAFSQNIAYHTLARYEGKPIQYYSLEMPSDQLLQRFVAMHARVSLQDIRQADKLSDEQWARISGAMEFILDHWKNRLLIDDEGAITPPRLRTKVRKYARQYGPPAAIFIDYLQLMNGSGRFENRNLEVASISRDLKKLAKEMQCPIYALSQLNRSLEQRANKRPISSDLRESGSLEQDADTILFIYRDEVYNPESEFKGSAEIIIGKQRNGPLGKVLTRFVGEYSLFENLDNHYFSD